MIKLLFLFAFLQTAIKKADRRFFNQMYEDAIEMYTEILESLEDIAERCLIESKISLCYMGEDLYGDALNHIKRALQTKRYTEQMKLELLERAKQCYELLKQGKYCIDWNNCHSNITKEFLNELIKNFLYYS